MMQKPQRPTGIGVLAILTLIVGVFTLLGGGFIAAVGGSSILVSYGYGAYSGLVTVFGVVLVLLGIVALVDGWGLWSGKGWAWTLAVVLSILSIIFSLLGLLSGAGPNIVNLIIDVLILWYLWRPHVKAFFGKGMSTSQPAPTMQAPPAPTQ